MGLCFNRFWDTVLPPSKLPFGTRGAHFAHLLRVPFWLILWNRFLMVLAPNMLPKVSAGSGSETAWGPRGSPRHPRSPFGLPLGSLWPPFGLLLGFLRSPLASPFAPLTSLWSPFGLGVGTYFDSFPEFYPFLCSQLTRPRADFAAGT